MSVRNAKKPRPKITDEIGGLLDGENLNQALDFIAYLKDVKINTQWTNTNTWKMVKKGITVGYVHVGVEYETASACYKKFKDPDDPIKGAWVVGSEISFVTGINGVNAENKIMDIGLGGEIIKSNEKIMNMLWEKLRPCLDCGNTKKCAPGITVTLCGKVINNRCKFILIPFVNPNPDELECVKELMNIYYEARIENQ
jgi:hypothetical protein